MKHGIRLRHGDMLVVAVVAVAASVALVAEESPPTKKDPVEELRRTQRSNNPVDESIRKALQFFKNEQNVDGSIGKRPGGRWTPRPTAQTALALLAFVATGHVPGEPRFGTVVEKGLDYLLADGRQDADGYFGGKDRRGMYTHGITTLLLVELLGMGATAEQDEKMLRACKKAIDMILRAQAIAKGKRDRGGWRYTPTHPDSDLSATVWQVTALRAARNIGLDIPERSIDEAVSYVRRCFHVDHGGFSYQPPLNNIPSPLVSTTAAGLFSLQVCGIYEGREVQAAADWLMKDPPPLKQRSRWFYYGAYYYAQAMHQLGERYEKHARPIIHGLLLDKNNPMQLDDGSFKSAPASSAEKHAGAIYMTAMAVLALSAEYELLPVFQR